MCDRIYSRRQKAEGFYVYDWYVVVWVVKSVLTFIENAVKPTSSDVGYKAGQRRYGADQTI